MRKQLSKSEQSSCPWAAGLALALLLALSPAAQADVWGFIDDKGVAHFASQKLDDRYQLFFKEATTPQIKPGALPQALGGAGRNAPLAQPALKGPAGAAGTGATSVASAASAPPKLAAFFEVSTGYKAVRHLLRDAAKRHNLDYDLLKALITAESGFDAQAISPKGAVGLMQLMPPTAARYGVRPDPKRGVVHKLVDPATNIAAGSRYLSDLIKLFPGRLDLAVAAYNAGEGAVQRNGNQIPPYKETQNYVVTVLQLYTFLKPPGFNTAGLIPSPLLSPVPAPASQPGTSAATLAAAASPGLAASGGGPRVRVQLPGSADLAAVPTPAQPAQPVGMIPGRGNMVPGSAVPVPNTAPNTSPNTSPNTDSNTNTSSASDPRAAPTAAASAPQ
jgi:soluble lytic murein transglycosylase-like protein